MLISDCSSYVCSSDLLAQRLSISGLHMGLVASILFFGIRGLLALWERAALCWPIKKWAAGAAIIGSFAYLLLSGADVPTQRSFVMTGLVLLAVILDRTAISLQLVARSEEHMSELQSLMSISYAVFCLQKKTIIHKLTNN